MFNAISRLLAELKSLFPCVRCLLLVGLQFNDGLERMSFHPRKCRHNLRIRLRLPLPPLLGIERRKREPNGNGGCNDCNDRVTGNFPPVHFVTFGLLTLRGFGFFGIGPAFRMRLTVSSNVA